MSVNLIPYNFICTQRIDAKAGNTGKTSIKYLNQTKQANNILLGETNSENGRAKR